MQYLGRIWAFLKRLMSNCYVLLHATRQSLPISIKSVITLGKSH